ncbi:hypothetical protein EJ03DRAFT_269593 [Teratosphaeria nubilosa]|uniref:Peptidase S54 rhomboid domain-containing protein n=1 Tax=Teratosphaeria nubilosa TaxID=161662 RepID=A0A6G1LFP6_9PEZI|nr:hypothetical protein EJ03DRAFT_269593 [Teratosphaeria nubilosa]
MPLPGDDSNLSHAEIDEIFGGAPHRIDPETGNYILRVLHWRRMSGALIDVGLTFPKWTEASPAQIASGLHYVRSLLPDYDERAAGGVWAEEESHRQAEVLRARAVTLGIYKDLEAEPMTEREKREAEEFAERESEREQGTEEGRARVGESALVRLRRQNEAKWEAEQAEKAARKERAEVAALHSQRGPLELLGGVQPSVVLVKAEDHKTWLPTTIPRSDWVQKYEEAATLTKDEHAIPHLSTLARLGPAFLVLVATLTTAYYLSETYTPPPKSARRWPETPTSTATLTGLTLLLLTTFLAFRLPPLWRLANKYFTLVPASPYALSLLGCMLRHDTLAHLASNLAFLCFFGHLLHTTDAEAGLTRGTFLALLLASGALGGYTSLVYNVLRHDWAAYITGFSSAVAGVTAAACVLRRDGNVHLPFTEWHVPYVAWLYLGLSVLGEGLALLSGMQFRFGRYAVKIPSRQSSVDHAGHVGGYVAGVGAAWWVGRRRRRGEEMGGMEGGVAAGGV